MDSGAGRGRRAAVSRGASSPPVKQPEQPPLSRALREAEDLLPTPAGMTAFDSQLERLLTQFPDTASRLILHRAAMSAHYHHPDGRPDQFESHAKFILEHSTDPEVRF